MHILGSGRGGPLNWGTPRLEVFETSRAHMSRHLLHFDNFYILQSYFA